MENALRASGVYHKCTSAHSKYLVSPHKRKPCEFQYVTAVITLIRTGPQSEMVDDISVLVVPPPARGSYCTVHRLGSAFQNFRNSVMAVYISDSGGRPRRLPSYFPRYTSAPHFNLGFPAIREHMEPRNSSWLSLASATLLIHLSSVFCAFYSLGPPLLQISL